MIWLLGAGFVLLIAAIGLMVAAFGPQWPPLDDTPLPPEEEAARGERMMGPEPTNATAEEWMWSPQAVHRAKHRRQDIGQGTIRLPWYEVPSGPQPIYPKADEVE